MRIQLLFVSNNWMRILKSVNFTTYMVITFHYRNHQISHEDNLYAHEVFYK